MGFGEQAHERGALRLEAVAQDAEHFGAGGGRRLAEAFFERREIVECRGRLAVEQIEQAVGAERRWMHERCRWEGRGIRRR